MEETKTEDIIQKDALERLRILFCDDLFLFYVVMSFTSFTTHVGIMQ